MKVIFSLLLFFCGISPALCVEETKTFLLNKDEYKYLEANNLLITEAIKSAFGAPNKQNNYNLDINQIDAWNSKVTEFKYYPGINGDNKKSLLNSSVINSKENMSIKLRVSLNMAKSYVNSSIKLFLDERNSFTLNIVVIADHRIFVSESKNKMDFIGIIEDQSFADKAFKTFFGENPRQMNYNIAFSKTKACLVKNILNPVCAVEYDLNKSNPNYTSFSDKITSAEYSSTYILFDLEITRGNSNLNQAIEDAIIKDADGTEHIKFYFCIPKDNLRAKKKKLFDIEGKILSGIKSAMKGLLVYLRDGMNTVISSQETDNNGHFKFDKLQEGASYSLYIDETCKEQVLYLTNKKEKIIGEFKKSAIGFEYKLLDAELSSLSSLNETDPSEEFMSFIKGKMVSVTNKINPLKGQVVELKNMSNQVIQSKKTDADGNFEFSGINPKENYTIEMPNYKEIAKNEKIYLANAKNELVTQFKKNAEGKFVYKILPADIVYLSTLEETDVEMTFNKQKSLSQNDIVIRDFIYYNLNSFSLLPESSATLEKIAKIANQNNVYKLEIISHTDCRGESDENLKLSQKRSESVMAFLVKNKVDPKRLKPVGMGEAKPLNSCLDGTECIEDEFKMNRRTEFKFYK